MTVVSQRHREVRNLERYGGEDVRPFRLAKGARASEARLAGYARDGWTETKPAPDLMPIDIHVIPSPDMSFRAKLGI